MRYERSPLLLSAFVCVLVSPEPARAQEEASYSVRVNPDGESFSLFLDHTVAVVGGSAALVVDPEVVRLEGIAKGDALSEGALLFSNLPEIQEGDTDPAMEPAPVFDGSGEEVSGGVLLGWSTAELGAGAGSVSVLPPGNDREIAVFFPFLGDGFDACAAVEFAEEGLRTTASGPLQGNIVTDELGDSVLASTVDGDVCLGPEMASVLASEPASILIDDGMRAVAFAGSFAAPPLSEAELGRLVFRNVGAGDVAALVGTAGLHADDGDGVFTDADPEVAAADPIDPATQEITFADTGVTIPSGETRALFLVLDFSEGSEGGAAASLPPPFPVPRFDRSHRSPAVPVFLAFVLLLLPLTAGVGRSTGARRAARFAAVVLLVALFASCGGGDGNGVPAAASSKGLQMQLVDANAGDSTGRSIRVDGLPITAWSF